MTTRLDEFIEFAKEELGINITAYESDSPDTFEKIFGFSIDEMRDLTPEERESYNKMIKNKSVSTGVNFMDFYKESDTDG